LKGEQEEVNKRSRHEKNEEYLAPKAHLLTTLIKEGRQFSSLELLEQLKLSSSEECSLNISDLIASINYRIKNALRLESRSNKSNQEKLVRRKEFHYMFDESWNQIPIHENWKPKKETFYLLSDKHILHEGIELARQQLFCKHTLLPKYN
jgi:hypothetical protein